VDALERLEWVGVTDLYEPRSAKRDKLSLYKRDKLALYKRDKLALYYRRTDLRIAAKETYSLPL